MKITILTKWVGCKNGSCPTVYKDELGRIFIQGFTVKNEDKENFEIPSNEDIIEIPKEFLDSIKGISHE